MQFLEADRQRFNLCILLLKLHAIRHADQFQSGSLRLGDQGGRMDEIGGGGGRVAIRLHTHGGIEKLKIKLETRMKGDEGSGGTRKSREIYFVSRSDIHHSFPFHFFRLLSSTLSVLLRDFIPHGCGVEHGSDEAAAHTKRARHVSEENAKTGQGENQTRK